MKSPAHAALVVESPVHDVQQRVRERKRDSDRLCDLFVHSGLTYVFAFGFVGSILFVFFFAQLRVCCTRIHT